MMDQINKYLANQEPVNIHFNNETGEWLYAVSVIRDDGFWLDAFKTKKSAENFCKKYSLPIKNFIKDK